MSDDPAYDEPETEYIPGRLVVTLTERALYDVRDAVDDDVDAAFRGKEQAGFGIEQLDEELADCNCRAIEPVFAPGKFELLTKVSLADQFVLDFADEQDLGAVIERLRERPEIAEVERDPVSYRDATPDDPQFGNQWHLPQIEIEDAWDDSQGVGTTIGVYDVDGVDANHPDLQGNYEATDDCSGDNNPAGGTNDHGTRVTGVCASVTDNNLGVAGSGWDAEFFGLRSSGASSNANAIECMVDEGADLIVTSSPIKQDSEPSTLRKAVRYTYRRGVPIVCSAGNAQQTIPYDQWPAANSQTLAVGNTRQNDARSGTSNYGPWLDVMAPGTGIRTTASRVDNNGNRVRDYRNASGTSYSTPLVGGVVALMLARNRTIGPRQAYEILRETTVLPDGTDTSDNRYGEGRIDARKALTATRALWKAVRYGAVPSVAGAVATSDSGWWIVGYSKSVFVGYKDHFWRKMVRYGSVANANPAVDINEDGDWIVTYSRSTFVGHRTTHARKMVRYPRRRTPGSVAINERGDWISVYSKSVFTGYKTATASKMVFYNRVPDVAGNVAINERGDWVVVYSKTTFAGYRRSSSVRMIHYGSVPDAAGRVDINEDGDWIVTYSRSTFVGHRTTHARKMVRYPRRRTPGSVAINDRGDWIAVYSRSTFVGYKRVSAVKRVRYNQVAPSPGAVDINENGDWIVTYSRSTFVGHRTGSLRKMVSYPRRRTGGDVAINTEGEWITVYSRSTFVGRKTAFASKRIRYNSVPDARGSVGINDSGDWIVAYSRTTFVGHRRRSSVQAVRHAPDDMSKQDIQDGYPYPPSTRPRSDAAVTMNDAGLWVSCFGRSTSVGERALFTNTHRFDP